MSFVILFNLIISILSLSRHTRQVEIFPNLIKLLLIIYDIYLVKQNNFTVTYYNTYYSFANKKIFNFLSKFTITL